MGGFMNGGMCVSEQKLQEGAGEIGTLRHIAFIMDGTGRWAQRRGQPREFGHRAGVKSLKRVAKRCTDRGIESITVYAFSTENWKRPKKEVDAILDLLSRYLDDCIRNHRENKVHVRILGDVSVFSESFREKMKTAEEITRIYPTCLNIALNYGGRAEIVHAYQKLRSEGKETVTEEEFERALYTADLPSLDMIVRTGGDLRLSNFLLWQAAYAELYFTAVLWPDMDADEVDKAIDSFYTRKRRYGGV